MKKKIITGIILIAGFAGGFAAWQLFGPNVSAPEGKFFYIKTGSTYNEVRQSLLDQKVISGAFFFDMVSKQLKYPKLVKAGRYQIKNGSSIYSLLRKLRSGDQTAVNLVINKLRLNQDLAQKIAANFECDSASVMQVLTNGESMEKYGVDQNTILTIVIPNTYSFFWNSTAEKIIDKLYREKEKFWNEERLAKARNMNLTPVQVYTMASIVEEETNKADDKGKIASVYKNRLAAGMKLQADPTVKFALQDFGLKRILLKHLNYPSPFNTYVNTGLPPGPICTPSINTIDAVLNAPETNYIFFVAKPDFNGYSNFATSYKEHMVYAKAYQDALDSLIRAKANQTNMNKTE
ncbi:MAG: endolytic transglycosylase MltG [Chitinophagaceae bacterium]|nr:endolytic transglycosylase MltG [Chitinophagaceae bacterium]